MIVDCHVNVYEDRQMLPAFVELTRIARAGGFPPRADPDTVHEAMGDVDRAIVFSLRYKDAIGIDGDDEVTARAVAKYPDKLIGFACIDPRMPDCMDLLVPPIVAQKIKGLKFGPISNGASQLLPRHYPYLYYL